tara:strand:- start:685 stop:1308 length:624 start_codon:yes stop_codon:yes gene_type:complete
MALVKYNNNSLSAITSTGLTAGAMTLIKEQTASSSATISFVHGTSDVVLDSTYPIYLFKWISCHPETNNVKFQFQANVSGGSGYNETITSTAFNATADEANSDASLNYQAGRDQAQGTSYQDLTAFNGNQNDSATSGELWIFSPSSTTFVKHFMSRSQQMNPQSPFSTDDYRAGYFNTTSAINDIQFKMSSGDIDAGTIKLYGIKDS